MRYAFFSETELTAYRVCLLVPNIRKDEIKKAYLETSGIDPNDMLVIDLHHSEGRKKTSMTEMRQYIVEELAPTLADMKVEYVLCSDGEYFKALTKASKIEAHLGYVMDCAFGGFKVIYVPTYTAIFYDPEKVKAKINQGITALLDHMAGAYQPPGNGIIKFAAYPNTDDEIERWLLKLLEEHRDLTADIEGFGLKHWTCGIGTISFAWNQAEGIAFAVDYEEDLSVPGLFGKQTKNDHRRAMLRRFFELCKEHGIRIKWHNIAFDVYVLIYQLFMEHILDQEGLLYGLDVLLGDHGTWDCTKLITYLATNSCAGNKLGLKDQAQEYSGNYAVEEIKDIRKIPLSDLLQYNLVDSLSTWYVFDKHYETMVKDEQLPVYQEQFQPMTVDIIQMQLTGMPVNMYRVLEVEKELQEDEATALLAIQSSATVRRYTDRLNERWVYKRNNELKKKRVTLSDAKEVFNPNSAPQLQDLLFQFLQLPVLGYTKTKEPGTDGDTIKALQKHTNDPDILAFLKGLEDYKAVNKIITDFIPSLKNAQLGNDGWHYLFGNFNLGGTKSGRLSSSGPNLQNLPASSRYAKAIKSCFEAPPGWLFTGLDFDSLEDKISALTTKDPNKLKVYTDGYDGHCLRAYSYYQDKMPDIDPTSVSSINSIAFKYKAERQESKDPTFALTYKGTFKTLMVNCGFSEEKAKAIEAKYHELYVVSDRWVDDKLDKAAQNGYVSVAFGLRLRTPMLHQVIRGMSKTPHQAEAEGRTAGNALGQSYCMLNSRAGVEFNGKVRKSQYRLDIKPCAQIHDAQYFLMRDDISVIKYANDNLVKAVKFQELPEIEHDEVKLGGKLGIFYPTWKTEITLPNDATEVEIISTINEAMQATA
jgi:DNA polymerase-1